MSRRGLGLAAFLLLTFGATYGVEFAVLGRMSAAGPGYVAVLTGVMFIPGLSALAVRRFVERGGFGDAGLHWGAGRWYLVAWLLPPALGAAAMALTVVFGQAEFDPWMTEMAVRMHMVAPNVPMPPVHVLQARVIGFALTAAVVVNSVAAFGEEFGWRGYLLMRLLPLGTGRAVALTGVIWGLWHTPIVLQGHNYPEHPQAGVALMTGFCILLGAILAWLRLASGSVFPAAVAHGSANGPGSTPLLFLRGRSDLTGGLTGLIGQAVMAAVVCGLWRAGAFRGWRAEAAGPAEAAQPGG